MSWMNLSRAAKVVALLAFLLPWMAISCNGTPLAEATGLGMITGDVRTVADGAGGPFGGVAPQQLPQGEKGPEALGEGNWWVALGAAVIGIGLVLGFVMRPAVRAAQAAMIAAVAALVLLGGGMAWTTEKFKSELREAMAEQQAAPSDPDDPFAELGRNMAAAMATAVRLEVKFGYWLCLGATAAAAAAAGMAAAGRGGPVRR